MTRAAEAACRRCRSALLALVGAVLLSGAASAQERETLRITPPDPRPESAAPDPRRSQRAVQWTLSSTGDWVVELEGRATAQLNGNLVQMELLPEGGGSPLLFHVVAEPGELSHVGFSQTTEPPVSAAGIGARGANWLTEPGRDILSLSGNQGDPGTLVNHDGFVRVDRRDGRLVIRFATSAVYCVGRTEPPFVSTFPCDGPLFLSKDPAGWARVTGCIAATEDLQADPGACDLPLQIDEVTPSPGRENVALADPRLQVTFSEPVDIDTLRRSFLLHTLGADREPIPVSGAWEQDGPASYAFRPDEDLRSGTRYRAEIEGGVDTVLSEDRSAALEEGKDWSFSTWLEFDLQRPEEPDAAAIRLHHYQVDRDGPLTRDKPTLTRAWFDWQPHADIAADWQPDSFRMDVGLSDPAPRWQGQKNLAPRARSLRIWRSDDESISSERHRQLAHHTAQFYGWRPRNDGVFSLELRPHDPWPRDAALPQSERQEHDYTVWSHDPRPLRLHYAFAKVGTWAEGVPAEAAVTAYRLMQAVAREIPAFFPHREVEIRRLLMPAFTPEQASGLAFDADGAAVAWGDAAAPDPDPEAWRRQESLTPEQRCSLFAELFPHAPPPPPVTSCTDSATERMEALVGHYHRRFHAAEAPPWSRLEGQARNAEAAAAGRADVIALFVPPEFFGGTTVGFAAGMAAYRGIATVGFPGMRIYAAAIEPDVSFDEMVQLHLHELGHEFGLEHVPGDAMPPDECSTETGDGGVRVWPSQLEGRREPGIEAWRMAPGGLSGWNKSASEGNAQVEDGTLVSMMWPYIMETRFMALLPEEMERMRQSIEIGPSAFWSDLRAERAQRPADAGVCDARLLSPLLPRHAAGWGGDGTATLLDAVRLAHVGGSARSDAWSGDEVLVVGGLVSDTGGGLMVRSVQRLLPSDLPTPPDGPYQARITDLSGRVLAVAPVGLRPPTRPAPDRSDPSGWHRFQLEIALPDGAANLTILDGQRVRATLPAGLEAPTLEPPELKALGEGRIALQWRLTGHADQQSVAYSPTGQAPWSMLVHNAPDGRAELFLNDLPPGPAPSLRISARSGARFVDRVVPLPEALLPVPRVTVLPPALGEVQLGAPVVLQFDTPMPWSLLADVVGFADPDGRELETRAVADPGQRTLAVFFAETRAQPGHAIAGADGAVHLVFRAPLRDAFGRPATQPAEDALTFPPAPDQD